jgi:hypothetical protein
LFVTVPPASALALVASPDAAPVLGEAGVLVELGAAVELAGLALDAVGFAPPFVSLGFGFCAYAKPPQATVPTIANSNAVPSLVFFIRVPNVDKGRFERTPPARPPEIAMLH